MSMLTYPDPRIKNRRPSFLNEFGVPLGLDRHLDFQTRLAFHARPTALGTFSQSQMNSLYTAAELESNRVIKGAIDRAASAAEYLTGVVPGNQDIAHIASGLLAVRDTISPSGPLGLDQKFNGKWQIEEFYDVVTQNIAESPALNSKDVDDELSQALSDGSGGKIKNFNELSEEAYHILSVWKSAKDRILKEKKIQAEFDASIAKSLDDAEQLKREAEKAEAERRSLPSPPPPKSRVGASGLLIGSLVVGGVGVALLLYKMST